MSAVIILLFSLIVGKSVASATGNGTTNSTAGSCIFSKWKLMTSINDVNRDGKISVADSKKASKVFSKLYKLKDDREKIEEDLFTSELTSCFLWDEEEVYANEYGVKQRDAFLEDKNAFIGTVQTCLQSIIDINNINGDGYISEREERAKLIALGFKDVKNDKKFFKSWHPKEKGSPIDEALDYWLGFFTNDDCSREENKLNILKN